MSEFYTLIMGLLVHLFMISWFEIVEFSQFLIIWLSGTGKQPRSENGQISVKEDNIFELSVLNQI